MSEQPQDEHATRDEFREQANQPQPGLFVEFWYFLRQNKKWWLIPLLLTFLVLGALVVLSSTGLGPLIYPLM